MRGVLMAAAAILLGGEGIAAAPEPVQVMIVGAYHFGNPGRDIANMQTDDVTTPRRQRELGALADALLAFRPTRVMVEAERAAPGYEVAQYRSFAPADLLTKRDEMIQIAYRVAARAGLKSVQGIDVREKEGGPSYFPFDDVATFAKGRPEEARLQGLVDGIQSLQKRIEARQPTESIPALLLDYNDPASPIGGNDFYYETLKFGEGDRQPGAMLNAMWYMRNARIFAKLTEIALPGDRVLVVYGAGHGYWLRHFAATVPGYRLVDVRPYLERAAAAAN